MDVWCLTFLHSQAGGRIFYFLTLTEWVCDVLLPCNHSLHTESGSVMSYFPAIILYTHTGWKCDVLLPCSHSLYSQDGSVMSYFPAVILYTHRPDACVVPYFPTLIGWMRDVIFHYSLRVGAWFVTCQDSFPKPTGFWCVMSNFPDLISYTQGYLQGLIHYTHRVDVWCLTSLHPFYELTRWMCDVLLSSAHSLHS